MAYESSNPERAVPDCLNRLEGNYCKFYHRQCTADSHNFGCEDRYIPGYRTPTGLRIMTSEEFAKTVAGLDGQMNPSEKQSAQMIRQRLDGFFAGVF